MQFGLSLAGRVGEQARYNIQHEGEPQRQNQRSQQKVFQRGLLLLGGAAIRPKLGL